MASSSQKITLSPEQLKRLLNFVFEENSVLKCSKFLNVNIRTIQRWRNGDAEIPETVIEELVDKMEETYDDFLEKIIAGR